MRDAIAALGRQVRCLQFDIANREQTQSVLLDDVEKHGAYYGVVSATPASRATTLFPLSAVKMRMR